MPSFRSNIVNVQVNPVQRYLPLQSLDEVRSAITFCAIGPAYSREDARRLAGLFPGKDREKEVIESGVAEHQVDHCLDQANKLIANATPALRSEGKWNFSID